MIRGEEDTNSQFSKVEKHQKCTDKPKWNKNGWNWEGLRKITISPPYKLTNTVCDMPASLAHLTATWGGDRRTTDPGTNGCNSSGGGRGGGRRVSFEEIQQRNLTRGESVGAWSTEAGRTIAYDDLYNNQIIARPLIGQLAVDYCASKPTEKPRVLWIIR